MDTINPEQPPLLDAPAPPPVPRVWKFWGTLLWGLWLCAAMFAGQTSVIAFFVLRGGIPADIAATIDTVTKVVTDNGLAISLSVIAGLPAIAAAAWFAIRWTRIGFADYLALRR